MELETMLKYGGGSEGNVRKIRWQKEKKKSTKVPGGKEKNTCAKMCHSPRHGAGTNSNV